MCGPVLLKKNDLTYGDIMNEVIWNNKNILSQGKSIYLFSSLA